MDRYTYEWQLRNYEQAPYYNYPTTGYEQGVRLNDTISPDAAFYNLFNSNDDVDLGDGPYTIRNIFDGTTFLTAQYTYDTILELIYQPSISTSTTELPLNATDDIPSPSTGDTDGALSINLASLFIILQAGFCIFT